MCWPEAEAAEQAEQAVGDVVSCRARLCWHCEARQAPAPMTSLLQSLAAVCGAAEEAASWGSVEPVQGGGVNVLHENLPKNAEVTKARADAWHWSGFWRCQQESKI